MLFSKAYSLQKSLTLESHVGFDKSWPLGKARKDGMVPYIYLMPQFHWVYLVFLMIECVALPFSFLCVGMHVRSFFCVWVCLCFCAVCHLYCCVYLWIVCEINAWSENQRERRRGEKVLPQDPWAEVFLGCSIAEPNRPRQSPFLFWLDGWGEGYLCPFVIWFDFLIAIAIPNSLVFVLMTFQTFSVNGAYAWCVWGKLTFVS